MRKFLLSFALFFAEIDNIDIHSDKYCNLGTSKAKKLRSFWSQTEGALLLDANCAVVDVTVMATTGQNIFVQAPSSPTYATSGLSVAA